MAEGPQGEEHKLKAAFVYQFTKYIEWPSLKAMESFNIAVEGDSHLISALDEVFKDKNVNGKAVQISNGGWRGGGGKKLNIFVITSGSRETLRKALDWAKGRELLTISGADGLGEAGSVINFYSDQERLRFEINTRSAADAGLVISSQLLKLARIVK